MNKCTVLRCGARIISVLALLLFGLMFLQDGLPVFLFGNGEPALVFHMWALLAMLVCLVFGVKWEGLSAALVLGIFAGDEIALFIYGLGMGMPEGLIFPLSAFSFPFMLFPMGGLSNLASWAWKKFEKKRSVSFPPSGS